MWTSQTEIVTEGAPETVDVSALELDRFRDDGSGHRQEANALDRRCQSRGHDRPAEPAKPSRVSNPRRRDTIGRFKRVPRQVGVMDDDSEPVVGAVREYYEALRSGEPLAPFFLENATTAKVGVSERLVGHETVTEALREQTRRTTDWTVESHDLAAGRRGDAGWFADRVAMAWTDGDDEFAFDTRWTGALVRAVGDPRTRHDWPFVELHVSAARELDGEDA